VNTTGDGFLATFDGPARAIRCARAITEAVGPLGIEVRCGLHTGEVELVGDDVAGLAVHIAARIASLAGPSEVVVSRTVKDLVAGSGFDFRPVASSPEGHSRPLGDLRGGQWVRVMSVKISPARRRENLHRIPLSPVGRNRVRVLPTSVGAYEYGG
jgi:class 3 adenylate cyclase